MELALPISVDDMVRELQRERAQRERVYPRLVQQGRLRQKMADRQLAVLDATIKHLQDGSDGGNR